MKKILITGKNSYIGMSFEKYISIFMDKYKIDTLDMLSDDWHNFSFSNYDVVFHVAGIAHISTDPKMESMYYKINRDLAIDVAKKAKNDGVKQFIFMSSMIVYGDDNKINENKAITIDTIPNPTNFYGKSKLEADIAIQKMSDEKFKTVIVRTPLVYGKGCKGNFPKLKKISNYCFIFPDINNQRSMIYIDNLCEFFKQVIDNEKQGVFFPQNKEYVATKNIISEFRKLSGKKTYFSKIFNLFLNFLSKYFKFINKVFGNKIYDKTMSDDSYIIVNFEESIKRCL